MDPHFILVNSDDDEVGNDGIKRTIIKKYDRLKVFEVDSNDSHMKKFTPKTTSRQGCLKVCSKYPNYHH